MTNINKVNGRYVVELTQKELNTISLLLGHSSDKIVVELGEDYEGYSYDVDENTHTKHYTSDYVVTGRESEDLWDAFRRYRTTDAE